TAPSQPGASARGRGSACALCSGGGGGGFGGLGRCGGAANVASGIADRPAPLTAASSAAPSRRALGKKPSPGPVQSWAADFRRYLERIGSVFDREDSALFDHDLMGRDRRARRLGGLHLARNFLPVERGSGPDAGSHGDKSSYCSQNDDLAHRVTLCGV